MANDQRDSFELLDARQYLKDLTYQVSKAKHRIALMSPILADDNITHGLINELILAAKRGVDVNIAADVFTFSELGGYFSPFKWTRQQSHASAMAAVQLKNAGATFTWLGRKYQVNPFRSVTHIKWAIVDTTTYSFGGTNIYEEGIGCTDFMLRSYSPLLADQIYRQHQMILSKKTSDDYRHHVSKDSKDIVYIDGGKPKESVIYDRICELADKAKHVLVVTQYCPSGLFARQLQRTDAKIYYNQPKNMPRAANLLIRSTQLSTGLRSLYPHVNYLHAKFIIFTMPSGERITVTGSHNFTYSSVRLGTREVALETNDPHVSRQLEDFYVSRIM